LKVKKILNKWAAIEKAVLRARPVRIVLLWSMRRSLPGFSGIPVYNIVRFILLEFRQYDLFIRANATAFSFFLSLFPALIALFTLIPWLKRSFLHYLPEGEMFDSFLQAEIQRIMPGVAGQRLFEFIEDITNNPRVGLLSFGFLTAIYFASNGMLTLMQSFEKSYPLTFKQRGAIEKRGIAIFLTFLLGLMLIGSVVLIIMGDFLIHFFVRLTHLDLQTEWMLKVLRWLVTIALFYIAIGAIYRHGAATRKKFRLFTPGATVATVGCILASLIFSAYVNYFNTYNQFYGSIGAIIILMLWIQLNVFALLGGFEINAGIAVNRDKREDLFEQKYPDQVKN